MSRLAAWFGGGLLVLLVLSASPAFAQRELKDIPDPDPEIERKSFIVADGFEVNLFAADPLLHKPIQMNFDPQGRLWIAASEIYPQIAPGQKANDKILVLEDTDGDGRSDKTTVFADGLLIPTGVEPGDGGAYVAASAELLHLKDTDGDGQADESRVVLSGFGTEDTHHILHTLRWGPDGMLYMNQSVYIHSHIETPHGVRRLNAGGIWQFRPETMKPAKKCLLAGSSMRGVMRLTITACRSRPTEPAARGSTTSCAAWGVRGQNPATSTCRMGSSWTAATASTSRIR